MVKAFPLAPSFVASTVIHLLAFLWASALFTQRINLSDQNFVAVTLWDPPREEKATPLLKEYKALAEKKHDLLPKHMRKPVVRERHAAPPTAPATKDDSVRPSETDVAPAPASEHVFAPTARVEGGGSKAGVGNLFGTGEVGVIPGSGGGGGTAASGLGLGSGVPGLPAQSPLLRTNREAKPIQAVKATYPTMALRMGMESDVTLRLEVDSDGKVTHAEITKSGGAGFDEEALKAVNQARFEPAQRDGHNVPAEFIYIYRFRIQR